MANYGNGSSPYHEVRRHLPPTWNTVESGLCDVPKNSAEFKDVMGEFKFQALRLNRHQNLHQYGMFLIRQQHLQVLNPNTAYVKVTRYCMLKSRNSVESAIQYNLDPRRIDETISYTVSPPNSICHNNVVLVVSCITNKTNFGENNLLPDRDSDIYIEYVVYF